MNETLRLRNHYHALLQRHGDTAEAAQYSSRESQERRFLQLMRIGDLRGSRVLDFGCGTGHLATFLSERDIRVAYTGVDVVEELLSVGRAKHPHHRFGQLTDFTGEAFDYVMVSGVYNNRRTDNRRFWQSSVRELFGLCTRGLAFNMMSAYVDFEDPHLFYEKPETVFTFVKQELTPFVNLLHDYEVKAGVIPFEFCIQALKAPAP
ncbi:MAG: methyltransferase [Gammaproteobacteria bacterium]|nr:methyltransferase [Gammaproteobacteria bacterium]